MSRPDDGLAPRNHAELNADFYDAKPWVYFDRRLTHLALIIGNASAHHDLLSRGVDVGPFHISVEQRELRDDQPSGLDDQAFAAAEAQVLWHHAAETLLRLCHAHAPREDGSLALSPWLELSRWRSPGPFKQWVRDHVHEASPEGRQALIQGVYGAMVRGDDHAEALARYLALAAEHFLDAASYNAAKHGLALHGGHSRLTVAIDGFEAIRDEGLTIEWLGIRGPAGRWTRTTRWFSVEATLMLAYVVTRMTEALWLVGRSRYVGEPLELIYDPPAADELFASLGVVHPVLAEVDRPLAYEGTSPTLLVQKRVPRE